MVPVHACYKATSSLLIFSLSFLLTLSRLKAQLLRFTSHTSPPYFFLFLISAVLWDVCCLGISVSLVRPSTTCPDVPDCQITLFAFYQISPAYQPNTWTRSCEDRAREDNGRAEERAVCCSQIKPHCKYWAEIGLKLFRYRYFAAFCLPFLFSNNLFNH